MTFSSLRPLRQRSFALLWSAALVSNVGSWMQTVAVGILVTARTGRPGWTGLVAAAAFVPIGLLAPVGGALADRVDRRRWLLLTTAGETMFAIAMAVLVATGRPGPGLVTLLVFGGGAMAALGFPAYQAMIPDLVGPDDLLAAVSLSSAQFNLGRVVGPALAGVVIVAGGYAWAFAFNAASFVAVMVALGLLRLPRPIPAGAALSLGRRLADGARATAAEPACRFAVLGIGVVALTASPFIALVPAVALKTFAAGSAGTSLLVTAQGVGAVAGALALAPLAVRFGRRRVLFSAATAVCVALGVYALAPFLWLAVAAIACVGATYIAVLSGLNTTIQLRADPAVRARVLGIYMMALGLLYPVGAVLQGTLADQFGLRAVTAGGAAVLLVGVVAARRAGRVLGGLDQVPRPAPAVAAAVVAGPPGPPPG